MSVQYEELRFHCMQLKKLEQAKQKLENQIAAVERDGVLATEIVMAPMRAALGQIAPIVGDLKNGRIRPVDRAVAGLMDFVEGTEFGEWLEGTRGVKAAVVFGVGLMPPLSPDWIPEPVSEPRSAANYMLGVRACYKYAGLDVKDGHAPKRERGKKCGFPPFLRAIWIARVAMTIEKVGGPYKDVYDVRKEYTRTETHPPMLNEGECEFCDLARGRTKEERGEHEYEREREALRYDCANVGGKHWSAGHRRADALRYTAKQVLKDAWLVANGKPPSVGHQAFEGRAAGRPLAAV